MIVGDRREEKERYAQLVTKSLVLLTESRRRSVLQPFPETVGQIRHRELRSLSQTPHQRISRYLRYTPSSVLWSSQIIRRSPGDRLDYCGGGSRRNSLRDVID